MGYSPFLFLERLMKIALPLEIQVGFPDYLVRVPAQTLLVSGHVWIALPPIRLD